MKSLGMEPSAASSPQLRAGMVAIVGRANVGKSTLLNRMLEEKVSIVSPVAQTTRNLVRAVLTEPRGQLVFLDTPGVHRATHDLGRLMNQMARTSVAGVDVVLLVLDGSTAPQPEDEGWMRRLLFHPASVLAVLNKSDQGPACADAYRQRWAAVAKEKDVAKSVEWLDASATTGAGVSELVSRLFAQVPVGPLLFPEDVMTDYPRKLAMADVIREKYFMVLRNELPHALAVSIDTIEEKPEGWRVEGSIYVDKPSQKPIVIGEKGRLLKGVRQAAEQELSALYETPVNSRSSVTRRSRLGEPWRPPEY
ncbi:MAG: GTPase Era [Kiritimatiellaeota bacterium]|nr:GTPase Era [Kiritimatiellota bacterium]